MSLPDTVGACCKHRKADSNSCGICVNFIAPDYTECQMTEKEYDMEVVDGKFNSMLSAKLWGELKDVSAACVHLSSPARHYVTWTYFFVDGGVLGRGS